MARLMREDVLLRPALEIKQNPMRQKFEAGLSQPLTSLAGQDRVEAGPQRMEMEHVRGGVAELLVAQAACPPVRALLLLRQLGIQKIFAQIAKPMSVGECARQPGRDLGAID